MAQKETWIWIIIAIVAVLVIGMFVQKQYELFAILPAGEYNANADCTFITNIDPQGTWEIQDYQYVIISGELENKWITIDINNDNIKEKFGVYGSGGASPPHNFCTEVVKGIYLTTKALGNFDIMYDSNQELIWICKDSLAYSFKKDWIQVNVIISCGQPPMTCSQLGGFICDATQTCTNWLTATDTTRCCNDPCTSQTCNTPADVNCNNIVERAELGAYAMKWINGQVTRQALGQAAMAWISGGF